MTMKINTVINNGTELILTGHWTQKQQSSICNLLLSKSPDIPHMGS